jgi:predicted nucleic acid-binding protein
LGSSKESHEVPSTAGGRAVGVTASKVLFDTSAWWEILQGSASGARLQRRYLDDSGVDVFTSAISLGELSAKLSAEGGEESISLAVNSIRSSSAVLDLTGEIAVMAGVIRTHLRRKVRSASLADGIVLATARRHGARLISQDGAFRGESDVAPE